MMSHAHLSAPPSGGLSAADQRAMRRVTAAAVAVSLLLVAIKAAGWSYTNTLSLLSSLADSLFDVLVSLINFFAIRYALKPADEEHRFGHNSIEDIAGLAQFAFICGSMLFIAAQAVQRLFQPEPIAHTGYGIGVMAVSLALTSALVLYQRRVSRRTGSLIVRADALHYLSDVLMNLAIIASLAVVAWQDWYWLDAALAIAIALYVIREAWGIGKRAFNNLMDREMPEAEKQTLINLLETDSRIAGYHHLRTRYSGMKPFIQIHIEIDRKLSFEQAHTIAEALERRILDLFPHADVILHQDPV